MRAVIYTRYSSDQQRAASIEDQIRLARELVEHRGWALARVLRTEPRVVPQAGVLPIRPCWKEFALARSILSSPKRSIVCRAIRRTFQRCINGCASLAFSR